jgi:Protein of unknown function (DUF1553)/Protein of unknown function (DUF1549)/Bacterial Ig-like domain (group 2)
MGFVRYCRSIIVAAILLTLGVPGIVLLSQTKDPALYHKPGDSKVAPKPLRHVQPVADHAAQKEQAEAVPLRQLKILPTSLSLTIPRLNQRLVVEGTYVDGHHEDLTSKARITSSNPQIALIDKEYYVHPESDGQATITAEYQGHQAAAPVAVKHFSNPFAWSFRNHVLPVMTKVGCNSGPCHGAAAGKNGFKLTLRGYDPETDYYTLTHPARSLILLKPTMTIAHGGGQRFPVGSPEYQVIAGWIAAGMPRPEDSDPRIVSLQVLPKESSLRPGAEQQLLVMANFSDGHTEDVTRWAKFTSGNEAVATVDDNGHVVMHSAGEAPVTIWYLSKVTFARLRIPYAFKVDEAVYQQAPIHNYIDKLVLGHLRTLHIPPSRPAADAEFIRRAYLDAAGILPSPAEVEQFLKDRSPDKRNKLIDKLIARPEFADYWAYKWSDVLLVSSNRLSSEGMWSYYRWIRQSVAENKPWDKFVGQIINANGNARENGAANYWVIHRNPTDIAENVTVAFLGVNITCAHCHNHPLAEWTQKDYYGMANLFSRVRLKMGAAAGNRPGVGPIFQDVSVFSSPTGQYTDDRFTRPLPPKPLLAPALPIDTTRNLREYFAEWLTSKDNPYFARALVNRVWRNFMGRGLVEPVDDMRATNPPTHEDLLNALTQDFVESGFDVNHLIRTIMQSATYQTSSQPTKENMQDEKYYSHYLIRRLPAEVMLDGISQVTQVPEKFEAYPLGMRALQLPDTAVKSYFLDAFGRPPRAQTRESERMSEPTITQALHIINGDTLNNKLRAQGSSIDMLVKLGLPDEQVVDYLFLSAFSRHPSESELGKIVNGLHTAEEQKAAVGANGVDARRTALVDLGWAVLTSQEFMFNH